MKQLLFCVSLFTAATYWPQKFNVSYHDGKEISFDAVSIGSALYYLEHSQKLYTCCSKELNLVKARDGGQIIFL